MNFFTDLMNSQFLTSSTKKSDFTIYKKIIVVTGGAGFLGRNLCNKLLENHTNHVVCVDNLITGSFNNIQEFLNNDNFTFINEDIVSLNFVNTFHFLPHLDEIYHLACIASPDKYKLYSIETLTTCFQGTKNVLDLAKKYNSKLLFTSTSEIYGDPLVHPQTEDYYGNVNTMGERSCYDEGKRVAETLIYEYERKFDLNLKVVRIFNTYGPYMDLNDGRVITNFIKQIKYVNPVVIYGSGNQTRSFCYVDDMIDGLLRMMQSKEKGPINLGNPNCEFTLLELVKIFEKVTNKNVDIRHVAETQNDPKQRKPDITQAREKIGFEPKILLEEGIKKTWDFFHK